MAFSPQMVHVIRNFKAFARAFFCAYSSCFSCQVGAIVLSSFVVVVVCLVGAELSGAVYWL